MKVGLNVTCLNSRPSGAKARFIGIYGAVIRRLSNTEFVIYEPIDCHIGEWFGKLDNLTVRHTFLPSEGRLKRLFSGLRYWGNALAQENFDLFEGFHLPLVRAPTGQTLLTIHDIRGVNSSYGLFSQYVFKGVLDRSINLADHIITVSESMKKEILNHYPKKKISVIYNGFDTCAFDAIYEADLLSTRQKLRLPDEFILAVGHFEDRKNYLRLVDALAVLRDRGLPVKLVIIGNDSGSRLTVEKRILSLQLTDQILILSGISDLELRCAYKLSSLFVFPSAYEGFGIPILEAMAAGCPMVLSDTPVFREITQNRGLYFPYDDVGSMASTIELGLCSGTERERLIRYGFERVKDFSFSKLGKELASLYGCE